MRGIRRAPFRALLSAGTMAVALSVVGGYLLLYSNAEAFLTSWGGDLDVSIYLRPSATVEQRASLLGSLRARPEVGSVRFQSRAEGLESLKREWPEYRSVLGKADVDLVEEAFLVRLAPVADRRAALSRLAKFAEEQPAVAVADYGREEMEQVGGALSLLKSGGAVLAVLLGAAALFIIGSTVRLAIRDRRGEIEIMSLCGATDGFIRVPLYIEGAIQGALGGLIALAIVLLLHAGLSGAAGGLGAGALGLRFPSNLIVAASVGGGIALGALGSALAAGRYLRT